MAGQEVCVCYFVEILQQSQPKISRHLAYLRSAGIVAARREGKWMHYRIVTPPQAGAAKILRETLAALAQEKDMHTERALLLQASCSPCQPLVLIGAPRPAPAGKALSS
jgi:ArsR family transcriptional regulator